MAKSKISNEPARARPAQEQSNDSIARPTQAMEEARPAQKRPSNEKAPFVTNQTRNAFKRKAIERERNNYEYINLVPCAGKGRWYEVPDHSALILRYVVQKDRVRPMAFNDDFSAPFYKYEIGYISVPNPEKLIQEIKDSGLYESHKLVNTDGEETKSAIHGYAIKLNREFTGAEIEELKGREEQRRIASLNVKHPNTLNPSLYLIAAEIARRVSYLYSRFIPVNVRQTLGIEATRKSYELPRQYRLMLMASERMDVSSQKFLAYVVERLTTMKKLIASLSIDIGTSSDINKRYATDYAKSLQALDTLEESVQKMLAQYQERLSHAKKAK